MKTVKLIAIFICIVFLFQILGCIASDLPQSSEPTSENVAQEAPTAEEKTNEPVSLVEITPAPDAASEDVAAPKIRVAALVGPTGMGLAYLSKISDAYDLSLYTAPDQVTAKVISGEVDIAAVPINLASVLYNKTNHAISEIAVNTLGVLYFVENGDSVQTVSDLAGKTIYATGQGSTPQYILEQILSQNGLAESVTVEYIAESSELVAKLLEGNEVKLAFLPEPQVSNACLKNDKVHIVLSANELWEHNNEAAIVQGVYIVQNEFLKENPDLVNMFLNDMKDSVDRVLSSEDAAAAIVEMGILAAEPIAKRAIPNANIVSVTGIDMKELTEQMLLTLFNANPKSIGGNLPENDFYYVP